MPSPSKGRITESSLPPNTVRKCPPPITILSSSLLPIPSSPLLNCIKGVCVNERATAICVSVCPSSHVGSANVAMNYIFGGNTLYPRGNRGSSSTSGHGPIPKPRLSSVRSCSEEPPDPHQSRWHRVQVLLSRLRMFTDCISAGAAQVSDRMSLDNGANSNLCEVYSKQHCVVWVRKKVWMCKGVYMVIST